MFGRGLLVSPVVEAGVKMWTVYLPRDAEGREWIDFWSRERHGAGETVAVERVPLFVRAGTVLPLGPAVQHGGEEVGEAWEVRMYGGADRPFVLYEDDAETHGYERGERAEIPLAWDDGARVLRIGARVESFPGIAGRRTFRVVRVGMGSGVGILPAGEADARVVYKGRALQVRLP